MLPDVADLVLGMLSATDVVRAAGSSKVVAIACERHLERMERARLSVSRASVKEVSRFLARCPRLQELRLHGDASLDNALSEVDLLPTRLRVLALRDGSRAQALVTANRKTLVALDLAANDRATSLFLAYLAERPLLARVRTDRRFPSLADLRLRPRRLLVPDLSDACPALRALDLAGQPLDPASIIVPNILALDLSFSKLHPDLLPFARNLLSLSLAGALVAEPTIDALARCANLRRLHLASCRVLTAHLVRRLLTQRRNPFCLQALTHPAVSAATLALLLDAAWAAGLEMLRLECDLSIMQRSTIQRKYLGGPTTHNQRPGVPPLPSRPPLRVVFIRPATATSPHDFAPFPLDTTHPHATNAALRHACDSPPTRTLPTLKLRMRHL